MNSLISTSDAATELDVSVRRVQAMISAGRLAARRIGRDWLINRSDLAAVRDRRPGRPKSTPPKLAKSRKK